MLSRMLNRTLYRFAGLSIAVIFIFGGIIRANKSCERTLSLRGFSPHNQGAVQSIAIRYFMFSFYFIKLQLHENQHTSNEPIPSSDEIIIIVREIQLATRSNHGLSIYIARFSMRQ